MAFALTSFEARGLPIQGVSLKRGIQQLVFNITGANTDVALDIGTAAGTFWTAAQADATYGAMAALALAILQAAIGQGAMSGFSCGALDPYVKVLALTVGNQYTLAAGTYGYNFAFNAGSAPTSYKIIFEIELNNGIFPKTAAYNL